MVAFASGGVPEAIVHGETGLLVSRLNMPGVTKALRRILEPGVAAKMGKAARVRAEAHYSVERFLRAHVELYERVMHSSMPTFSLN